MKVPEEARGTATCLAEKNPDKHALCCVMAETAQNHLKSSMPSLCLKGLQGTAY